MFSIDKGNIFLFNVTRSDFWESSHWIQNCASNNVLSCHVLEKLKWLNICWIMPTAEIENLIMMIAVVIVSGKVSIKFLKNCSWICCCLYIYFFNYIDTFSTYSCIHTCILEFIFPTHTFFLVNFIFSFNYMCPIDLNFKNGVFPPTVYLNL